MEYLWELDDKFVRDDYVFSELEFLSPARVLGLLIIFMIC